MDLYIECPICEQQFYTPAPPPTTQVVCPSCSRQFSLDSAVKIEPPQLKPDPKPPASLPGSRLAREATFAKPELPLVEPPDDPPNLHPLDPAPSSEVPFTTSKLPGTAEIRHLYQRRNKQKLIITLVTGGLLAAVIGILSGLLVMQLQKQSLAENDDPEAATSQTEPASATGLVNSDSTQRDPAGENSAVPKTNEPSTAASRNSSPKQEKPTRLADLPPQELELLNSEDLDECWEMVQPHLVGLRVTDARGTHAAIATIIDSRGWILTSYSAIEGASKIEVTASAKSIDELPSEDLLTDLVRGVIAIDPKNDLAVLSINRRFIISFADIKIAETNDIVKGEYLVQCAPPSKSNLYARTESKIVLRNRFDALDASGQSEAKRRELTDPDLTWVVATNDTTPLPGTPLVRLDGTLAAINVFAENGLGTFLTVDPLKQLLGSATDEIESLAVLGGSTADQGELITIEPSHPMREVSERLNQLGDACKQFGWIAQTESQFQDLQEFAQQVTKALIYVMENEDSGESEVERIGSLVSQWENTLTKRMSTINSDDLLALRKMNKIAKEQMKEPGRYVPFYGTVYIGGIDLADKLILKFDADQTFVNIPFEPSDGDPMLPQSQWLFFVRTPGAIKTINFKVSEDETIPTYSADLQFAIGPTK